MKISDILKQLINVQKKYGDITVVGSELDREEGFYWYKVCGISAGYYDEDASSFEDEEDLEDRTKINAVEIG